MCIIHTMSSADLIKLLRANGFQVIRVRGSHHQLAKPGRSGIVTVPHPKKDLGIGLVKAILRQAGLK
jgi:predicted RNA binding protein YcfA (HicA-like mRNA interferase family)